MRKYVNSGLSRNVVPRAVATYGDNPEKVFIFLELFDRALRSIVTTKYWGDGGSYHDTLILIYITE